MCTFLFFVGYETGAWWDLWNWSVHLLSTYWSQYKMVIILHTTFAMYCILIQMSPIFFNIWMNNKPTLCLIMTSCRKGRQVIIWTNGWWPSILMHLSVPRSCPLTHLPNVKHNDQVSFHNKSLKWITSVLYFRQQWTRITSVIYFEPDILKETDSSIFPSHFYPEITNEWSIL